MGPRVLVAEDEALIALSLADVLEAEGYEVALAPGCWPDRARNKDCVLSTLD